MVYKGFWDLAVHRLLATNRFPEFTSGYVPALCEAPAPAATSTVTRSPSRKTSMRHR